MHQVEQLIYAAARIAGDELVDLRMHVCDERDKCGNQRRKCGSGRSVEVDKQEFCSCYTPVFEQSAYRVQLRETL